MCLKLFNDFSKKYLAEIQLPGHAIRLLSITESSWPLVISITSYKVYMLIPAAIVDSSLQLSISAKDGYAYL